MITETEPLERTELDEPDLPRIVKELQTAQADANRYLARISMSQNWWTCSWDNMWQDGCVHPVAGSTTQPWPWNGASDSRLHIVQTIVQEHVTLDLVAFWSAKVQATSVRPFVHGRDVNVATRMLNWRIYTHMKRELLRELPMAFRGKHALGLMLLGVEWEQQREIIDVPISLQMIDRITQKLGVPSVMGMLTDPEKLFDKQLIALIQSLSPTLPTADAKGILTDLRDKGQANIPTVQLRLNKPVWMARRPCIDTIIPSETYDIQRARWVANRELVSETELTDRIETDGYDPDFVDEALNHKGVFAGFTPHYWPETDTNAGSNRDMVELYHFIMPYLKNGVPCKYRTVFCEAAIRGEDNLHAVHRKFEYDHQQNPVVALRRSFDFRPLLSSIGIADESYTDERDMKVQQDGLNNLSQLRLRPPMIVPTLRAKAVANQYGPNAVMPAMRPDDVKWPPLAPFDQVPLLVMQQVQMRLDRRYGIIGGEIDPEIKATRRQQLAMQSLGELELAIEMTHQLQQQYETPEDVQRVAGMGTQPWQFSEKDIQGEYEISATVDMKMIDIEQAKLQLEMLGELMPFKDAGGTVFAAAANIVSPELADAIVQDQMSPTAMQREMDNEYNAMAQIRVGIEPTQPQMANNNLRLQVIQKVMQQPNVAQAILGDPVSKALLENRIKYFTNQIQQYQRNPQIGRTLAPSTFNKAQPATVTQGTPQ